MVVVWAALLVWGPRFFPGGLGRVRARVLWFSCCCAFAVGCSLGSWGLFYCVFVLWCCRAVCCGLPCVVRSSAYCLVLSCFRQRLKRSQRQMAHRGPAAAAKGGLDDAYNVQAWDTGSAGASGKGGRAGGGGQGVCDTARGRSTMRRCCMVRVSGSRGSSGASLSTRQGFAGLAHACSKLSTES